MATTASGAQRRAGPAGSPANASPDISAVLTHDLAGIADLTIGVHGAEAAVERSVESLFTGLNRRQLAGVYGLQSLAGEHGPGQVPAAASGRHRTRGMAGGPPRSELLVPGGRARGRAPRT
jgi:hypothetical protein